MLKACNVQCAMCNVQCATHFPIFHAASQEKKYVYSFSNKFETKCREKHKVAIVLILEGALQTLSQRRGTSNFSIAHTESTALVAESGKSVKEPWITALLEGSKELMRATRGMAG